MLAKHSQQMLKSLWNKYTVSTGACSPHCQQSGVRRQGGRFRQAGTVAASWNKRKGQRVFPQHQSKEGVKSKVCSHLGLHLNFLVLIANEVLFF